VRVGWSRSRAETIRDNTRNTLPNALASRAEHGLPRLILERSRHADSEPG